MSSILGLFIVLFKIECAIFNTVVNWKSDLENGKRS